MLFDCIGHPIRQNHATTYPAKMLVFDTETKPIVSDTITTHKFYLAWSRYMNMAGDGTIRRDNWKFWHDSHSLCEYIRDRATPKTALHLYAHNAFFDLQVIGFFETFNRWNWKLEFVYDKGLTFLLVIKKGTSTIKVISTTNFFDYSLQALGENIGLPKIDVDFDTVSDAKLEEYARRDVEIASESLLQYIQFNKKHDTGRFSMTKASQAFSCYRHRFMDKKIFVHGVEFVQELEREAYFGGRTEAFRLGKITGGPFRFYDVNSMYPYVMQKYNYPCLLMEYEEQVNYDRFLNHLNTGCVIAEVSLDTDEPVYAKRINDRVCFPVGRFDTHLCTGALRYAVIHKHLVKVKRYAAYEPGDIFSSYVNYWYPLKAQYKRENNKIYTTLVKLFLNSLYGKFGEKRPIEEWREAPDGATNYRQHVCDLNTGREWIETTLFGVTIVNTGEQEGSRSFPGIAAHVTEYARLYLWEIMKNAGMEKILYCDTDSLAISVRDSNSFLNSHIGNDIGQLSIDKQGKTFEINGAKDYTLDSFRKLKGVPKNAIRLSGNTFQYDQFLGMVSHLRLGDTQGVITRKVIKKISGQYLKGNVAKDGKITPYVLGAD